MNARRLARIDRWLPLVLGLVLYFPTLRTSQEKLSPRLDNILRTPNDPYGYYQWLPGAIIEHDVTTMPYTHILPDGEHLSMFSYGVALLQLPFFLCAHGYVLATDGQADGLSRPYAELQLVGATLYAVLGLLLLYSFLRKRFGIAPAAVTVVVLLAGTNLFYYTVCEPGMSHVWTFFMFSLLLWQHDQVLARPTTARVAALILTAAWILLSRQLNALVLLFPLLAGTSSAQEVVARMRAWPWRGVLFGSLGAAVLLLPLLFYWHRITGQWIVFPYGLKGEHFNWEDPHGLDTLVSHQNGWFVYTPLMILVMISLLLMAWKRLPEARSVLFIWVTAWWVYSSWWCWWLGGSFGFRGFVEYYALLAIPLAWLVHQALRRTWSIALLGAFLVACIHFNVNLSYLYDWPWEGEVWTWKSVQHVYGLAAW